MRRVDPQRSRRYINRTKPQPTPEQVEQSRRDAVVERALAQPLDHLEPDELPYGLRLALGFI